MSESPVEVSDGLCRKARELEAGVTEAETEFKARLDSSSVETTIIDVKGFSVRNTENVVRTSTGGQLRRVIGKLFGNGIGKTT